MRQNYIINQLLEKKLSSTVYFVNYDIFATGAQGDGYVRRAINCKAMLQIII